MRIAVTGSIATDHLMMFPGRFADLLLADQLDNISLSFLVEQLEIRRGGVAANIAYGLASLGLRPLLVGAAGEDFDDHRAWLERRGVDTSPVRVSTTQHTARFLCTTDDHHNQIASFYPGAMSEARDIELRRVAGGFDLVVVAPNDPRAMLRHTEECRERGYRFAADPSQQLATLGRAEVRSLVDGAEFLFTNEYESELLLGTANWSESDVLERVGMWITTLGERGVRIRSASGPNVAVPAVPARLAVDPTGVGDAFRAGFLAGLSRATSLVQAVRIGATLATIVLECRGSQEYELDTREFAERLEQAYGPGTTSMSEVDNRVRVAD
jgi:adenosine kinase